MRRSNSLLEGGAPDCAASEPAFRAKVGTAAAVLLFLTVTVTAVSGQVITVFETPSQPSGPFGIVSGPDGALWFTESVANKIGRISLDGRVSEFPIPTFNSHPTSIVRGPDEALWFAGVQGRIGRISTDGAIREIPLSGLVDIAFGPDGHLWVLFSSGTVASGLVDRVGRLEVDGTVTVFTLPRLNVYANSLSPGPDGNMWFTEAGPSGNQIGRITMQGVITEFPIPKPQSFPTGITAGPDGNLWFVEENGNNVGRITTAGAITEFPIPTLYSFPRAIVTGPDGNLWFTEKGANKIGRVTVEGLITEFELRARIPGGDPSDITAGPDGNLWFTLPALHKIVRMSLGACAPDPTTLCLNSGRFKVEVSWRVPERATNGVGRAVPMSSDAGSFWFFNQANTELVVKVLDGRTVNGKFWFFSGALSNVEYTITVTDLTTGAVKTYFNPSGQLASFADTSAF